MLNCVSAIHTSYTDWSMHVTGMDVLMKSLMLRPPLHPTPMSNNNVFAHSRNPFEISSGSTSLTPHGCACLLWCLRDLIYLPLHGITTISKIRRFSPSRHGLNKSCERRVCVRQKGSQYHLRIAATWFARQGTETKQAKRAKLEQIF